MTRWQANGLAALILLFVAGLWLLKCPSRPEFLNRPEAMVFLSRAGMLSLVLGLGVFVFVGVWGMRQAAACFGGVLLVQVLLLSTLAALAPALDSYRSTRGIAETLWRHAKSDQALVRYGRPQALETLPFYTGRPVTIIDQTPEPEGRSALLQMPAGTWVVTDAANDKILRQDITPSPFQLVQQAGPLRLLQKVQ